MLSPPQPQQPTASPAAIMENDDDSELMDVLVAQLESRDQTVQVESANLLNDMNLHNQADKIEAGEKQDAKSRFKARQVRLSLYYCRAICLIGLLHCPRREKRLRLPNHILPMIQLCKHDSKKRQKTRKMLFGKSANKWAWKYMRCVLHHMSILNASSDSGTS